MSLLSEGNTVWARYEGYPYWPARIAYEWEVKDNLLARDNNDPWQRTLVYFFGTHNYGWTRNDWIDEYEPNIQLYSKKCRKKNFKLAITEADDYLVTTQNLCEDSRTPESGNSGSENVELSTPPIEKPRTPQKSTKIASTTTSGNGKTQSEKKTTTASGKKSEKKTPTGNGKTQSEKKTPTGNGKTQSEKKTPTGNGKTQSGKKTTASGKTQSGKSEKTQSEPKKNK